MLTMLPHAHAAWEESADWDDVVAIARAADQLGFHHLTCSEHVAVPEEEATVRGSRYWDPLATFGYLAAVTTRIHLATYVLVLGYHHPLAVAKRYGTLDRVASGRLILGVGVGTLRREFELLDAPFADRGARADDALRALRASLGRALPEYHGAVYDFDGLVVEPHAVRVDVPIWIGGRGARSLRRAVELGDGWAPFGLSPTEAARLLDAAATTEAWAVRSAPLQVVLQSRPIDPVADPESAALVLETLRAAGATHAALRFVHNSRAHFIEQLEATSGLLA